jgi:hypothetical protein
LEFVTDPSDIVYKRAEETTISHEDASFVDLTCDAGTISYTALLSSGDPLPSCFSYTSGSLEIVDTTAYGTYELVLTATVDSTTLDSASFEVTI